MTAPVLAKVTPLSFIVRAARLAYQALQEGRLSRSPRRWLIDLQHLRGVMANEKSRMPSWVAGALDVDGLRDVITQVATNELHAFLASGSSLVLAYHSTPVVSVILVLFNRAELTLRCLRSVAACSIPVEVVLVDNVSSDYTSALLDRTRNAIIIRQSTNEGFGLSVNAGAQVARGKYLLFLNNDAELLPGSLESAVLTAERSTDIGAVGGRLILPDGRLQEAGSIIWNDGTCLGYGRDDSPLAPPYSFTRDIDFCSAAFLLTPRELFLRLGGFDPAFSPAYYEDADYCVRLWAAGRRVVYEPASCVMHFEFASAASKDRATEMQLEKRRTFVQKHATWLQRQEARSAANVLAARDRRQSGRRVLVFDDRVPHRALGSGFPRAVELVQQLTHLGHFVTLYALSFPQEEWDSVYADIPRTVEVMTDHGPSRLVEFMATRHGYYDTIIVSRHHNMQRLRARLGDVAHWGARVIYDAEALSAMRDVERQRVAGVATTEQDVTRLIREEIDLARDVDVVLTVSDLESQAFVRAGISHVVVARHAVVAAPTPRAHRDRHGVLFVGAFDLLSPNQDAVLWFAREVLPRLDALLKTRVQFTVVGQNPSREILALASDTISVMPAVADLLPLYDRARIFIAPTRFSAGIPLKVIDASAHGLPVVCTSLLARQLAWSEGADLLAADTPEAFANSCASLYSDEGLWQRLRSNALRRIELEYAPEVFRASLQAALGDVRSGAEEGSTGDGARLVPRSLPELG